MNNLTRDCLAKELRWLRKMRDIRRRMVEVMEPGFERDIEIGMIMSYKAQIRGFVSCIRIVRGE